MSWLKSKILIEKITSFRQRLSKSSKFNVLSQNPLDMSSQRAQERRELDQKLDEKIDQLHSQTFQANDNANKIGDTLSSQINQAQDINNHMDKTQKKVDKAVVEVGKIKTTWDVLIAAILIILLIIAIIIVWVKAKPIKKKNS